MIIKDWWYAIKVCRKYKVTWNPFFHRKYAMYKIWYNDSGISENRIYINPFYTGFLDSFMHEVGHLVWYRKTAKKSKTVEEFESTIENTDDLDSEFIAWRYAKLARKKSFNSKRARWMFSTYFPKFAKQVGAVQAADKYYRYDRRIEK